MRGVLEWVLGRERGARVSVSVVRVYTRKNCGCCEKAMAVLREAQARHGFEVETVDLDTEASAELKAAYDAWVPVVEVGGKVRFKGQVNPALLDRLLVVGEERGNR